MQLNKKTFAVFFSCSALLFALNVFAEETSISNAQNESQTIQAVAADEAANLNVGQPSLLPDSPFYFLKNWSRGIQTFFNFDPEKKAELKLKFSSEKMAEAKELLKQNKIDKALETIKNSNSDMGKIKESLAQLRNSSTTDQILEKMAQKTVIHQKFLDSLQKNIPTEKQQAFAVLKETLINSYLSAEDPEKIQERLQKIMANQQGSEFKEIKNIQILEEIKNAAPENIKEKVENANKNESKNLEKKLEFLDAGKIEALKSYIEQSSGTEEKALSFLNQFKNRSISTSSLEKIEQIEGKIMQKIEENKTPEKIKALFDEVEKSLTQWESKINENKSLFAETEYQKMLDTIALIKKELEKAKTAISEEKLGEAFGQITAAKVKIETLARTFNRLQSKDKKSTSTDATSSSGKILCPALWDPVCAEDGKTYSNECVAENIKNLAIKYKGECKKPTTENQTTSNSTASSVDIANPASVYCTKSGYKLEIRTDANGGQYGVCIFGDGQECEEWKFFRKECGVSKSSPTSTAD